MALDLPVWPVSTAPVCVDGRRTAFQVRRRLLLRQRGAWDVAAEWTPVWVGFGPSWRDGEEPLPVGRPRDAVAGARAVRRPGAVPPPARRRAPVLGLAAPAVRNRTASLPLAGPFTAAVGRDLAGQPPQHPQLVRLVGTVAAADEADDDPAVPEPARPPHRPLAGQAGVADEPLLDGVEERPAEPVAPEDPAVAGEAAPPRGPR